MTRVKEEKRNLTNNLVIGWRLKPLDKTKIWSKTAVKSLYLALRNRELLTFVNPWTTTAVISYYIHKKQVYHLTDWIIHKHGFHWKNGVKNDIIERPIFHKYATLVLFQTGRQLFSNKLFIMAFLHCSYLYHTVCWFQFNGKIRGYQCPWKTESRILTCELLEIFSVACTCKKIDFPCYVHMT